MFRLIRLEWIKTFNKLRTYIGFIAICVVLPLLFIGLKLDKGRFLTSSASYNVLEQNFHIMGNLLNGFFVSQLAMYFLMVHIPFFIVLVAGDQIAGEATAGTLRMVLIRPPSRMRIFAAKVAISLIYTIMMVLCLAVLSLGLGIILFGTGDLLVREEGLLILSEQQAVCRFLIAYPLAMLAMGVVAALALLLSVLVENAIGPIIGTMAIVVISFIISETPISLFVKIRPFLFTTYSKVWQKAFLDPIPFNDITISVIYLFLYMVLFLGAAFFIFNRRDILS
ncbi:MAG: ABC transporter permease subunit [Deltaproteobacteria bacterium]|nr:ABC transporter permease subunit [Deltaproteobacteria bacterium]